MKKGTVLCLMVLMGVLGSVSAATINITDGQTYTHGFNDTDFYSLSGVWLDGGIFYLNQGQFGELSYAYQAPQGEIISSIDLGVKTYFEAGSWVDVSYSTDGTNWTSLGYYYPGYNQLWASNFNPDSNLVFVKYFGKNEGDYPYQFQLWSDSLTFTTAAVPEPMTIGLLTLGGLMLRRRK